MTFASPPRRGRPRSEEIDAAIVAAAVTRLAVDGYESLTLSAVAEEAGVGRPAIYRRYHSKAQLAADALLSLSAGPEPSLPTAPRDALRTLLGATAAALASPGAMTILGSMLAQGERDVSLLETFRGAVFEPRQRVVRSVLEDAMHQGAARSDLDMEVVIDLLFGSLIARLLAGATIDNPYLDRVFDTVWASIGGTKV